MAVATDAAVGTAPEEVIGTTVLPSFAVSPNV
jgi:hypothetical protein